MADLSHWDFAEHFCGYDAAALILGLEPRESNDEQHRVRVITERMELHHKYAIERIFHENFVDPFGIVAATEDNRIELISVKLKDLNHRNIVFGEETTLSDWLADRRQSKFENQEFERNVIAGWLRAIGMKSVYPFDRSQPLATEKASGRWPWGDHHTEPLGHLDAAAKRYWVNYEPTDPTTAPTNKDVSEWLITERKVSQKMAESIASMLRPDGLATGPRK